MIDESTFNTKTLVVGDEVIVSGGGPLDRRMAVGAVGRVTRLTATQLEVTDARNVKWRFARDGGRQIGADKWYPKRLSAVTPDRLAQIRRADLLELIEATRWRMQPSEVLEIVAGAIQRG